MNARYGLAGPRFEPPWGKKISFLLTGAGLHPTPSTMDWAAFTAGKYAGCMALNPTPCRTKAKKGYSYTATISFCCLYGMLWGDLYSLLPSQRRRGVGRMSPCVLQLDIRSACLEDFTADLKLEQNIPSPFIAFNLSSLRNNNKA